MRVMLNNERGVKAECGGQSSPAAAELVDLFQLEMDKLRNRMKPSSAPSRIGQHSVDALLERLNELAHRQEQEAERCASGVEPAGRRGAAGARQRQLADETEEAARRLDGCRARRTGRTAATARQMRGS